MIQKINWDDVPEEEVTPSMKRKIIWGEKIMIARMRFDDGFVVPMHSHENEQITVVQKGTMHFWFETEDSEPMVLNAGDSVVIPANIPHKALMIGDVEETDTWAPPRTDWLDGTDDYLKQGS